MAQTILTHGHLDHAASAGRFAELTGAPVRAVGRGHDDLGDGHVAVRVGGLELRVVATPGHTSDSLSFALPADHALLTGDTVLGRGTTVVAHPDASLRHLASLERIAALTGGGDVTAILPGHGPVVPDAAAMVAVLPAHRRSPSRCARPWPTERRASRTWWSGCMPRCPARRGRRLWPAWPPSWSTSATPTPARGDSGRRRARGHASGGSQQVSGPGAGRSMSWSSTARASRRSQPRWRSRRGPCSPSRGRRRRAARAPPG